MEFQFWTLKMEPSHYRERSMLRSFIDLYQIKGIKFKFPNATKCFYYTSCNAAVRITLAVHRQLKNFELFTHSLIIQYYCTSIPISVSPSFYIFSFPFFIYIILFLFISDTLSFVKLRIIVCKFNMSETATL